MERLIEGLADMTAKLYIEGKLPELEPAPGTGIPIAELAPEKPRKRRRHTLRRGDGAERLARKPRQARTQLGLVARRDHARSIPQRAPALYRAAVSLRCARCGTGHDSAPCRSSHCW